MNDDNSTVVTLKVRVTPEFREKIVSTAKQNNRSMNQEIVARLEQSFKSKNMDASNDEVADLHALLQQSMETNKKYFQMITEFLAKSQQ